MWNLAECLSEAGDHARAIQASEDAINLTQQLYGDTHVKGPERRLTHAEVVGHPVTTKLPPISAAIWRTSAPKTSASRTRPPWNPGSQQRAGPRRPVTTRAPRDYQALLADLARVLDNDHWLAQECRMELAELKEPPGPPPGDEPAPGARPKS